MSRTQALASLVLLLSVTTWPLNAKVMRVDIASKVDVLNGRAFGDTGPYERLSGRIYFSISVRNPHNRSIVDLAYASNQKDGEVEFSSDFVALRPKDPSKGNGSLILEIPNRGQGRITSIVDGGDWNVGQSAGDAWLLRHGFTVVTLGWQWDATGDGALRLFAPVAKENGNTITGLLRGDYTPWKNMAEIPLGHFFVRNSIGGTEYPVSTPDDPRNSLSVRDSRNSAPRDIPRSEWQFAHTVDGKLLPSNRHIHLNSGFLPGKIYEYVYAVSDPVVAGLGFAAVRDFAAYAKNADHPVTPALRVIAEGISQDGRFLRDFVYQGFNADENGRMALDGVLAHVAGAGRGSFNYRFAQPSRDAQPMSSVHFPTDVFPFTDQPESDPLTGTTGGLLDRATAEHVAPKLFFSNTSYEYWGRAASLLSVSADGKQDVTPLQNVRLYLFTGLQHFSGPFPVERGKDDLLGQQPESPLPVKYFWRAMIANMDSWVRNDTLPPPSAYPRLDDGTLVPLSDYLFPLIPGVAKPHEASEANRIDFGPDWEKGVLTLQPPKVGAAYPVLVPQCDVDGNDRAGIRLPEISVPLATYTGWNLRDPSIGAPDQRLPFEGSYLPFPKTAADRTRTGDPRKSIAERYKDRQDYLDRYAAAVEELIRERWVQPEDRSDLLKRGEQEWEEAVR